MSICPKHSTSRMAAQYLSIGLLLAVSLQSAFTLPASENPCEIQDLEPKVDEGSTCPLVSNDGDSNGQTKLDSDNKFISDYDDPKGNHKWFTTYNKGQNLDFNRPEISKSNPNFRRPLIDNQKPKFGLYDLLFGKNDDQKRDLDTRSSKKSSTADAYNFWSNDGFGSEKPTFRHYNDEVENGPAVEKNSKPTRNVEGKESNSNVLPNNEVGVAERKEQKGNSGENDNFNIPKPRPKNRPSPLDKSERSQETEISYEERNEDGSREVQGESTEGKEIRYESSERHSVKTSHDEPSEEEGSHTGKHHGEHHHGKHHGKHHPGKHHHHGKHRPGKHHHHGKHHHGKHHHHEKHHHGKHHEKQHHGKHHHGKHHHGHVPEQKISGETVSSQ